MILNDVVTAGAVAPTLGPAAHVAVVVTDPVTAGAVAPAVAPVVAPAANAAVGAFSTFWTGVVGFAKGTVLPFLATPAALYIGLGLVGLLAIMIVVKKYNQYNMLTSEENEIYKSQERNFESLVEHGSDNDLRDKLIRMKEMNPRVFNQFEKEYGFKFSENKNISEVRKEILEHVENTMSKKK